MKIGIKATREEIERCHQAMVEDSTSNACLVEGELDPPKPRMLAFIDGHGEPFFRAENSAHDSGWRRAPWLDEPEQKVLQGYECAFYRGDIKQECEHLPKCKCKKAE